MAGFQKFICMGNLTKDPDTRYTQSGMAVCEFTVAVNGTKQDETFFGVVVVFGKTAEACRDYLAKGSTVLVEGKLKNEEWTDREGRKQHKTRIYGDQVQFIGRSQNPRQNGQSAGNSGGYSPEPPPMPPMP